MTIDELRAERFKLESNIRDKVADALLEFRNKTGMTPSDIYIKMVETTKIEDKHRSYSVGDVDVRIDI